ncbi:hypothetical protein GCM10009827_003380 [Dactylosporangium maewongense]|uniref:Uncharacterized protein n=1 Tax=Dactylosporangium maewongense TaxID=634393 RepID=A0ABN1ZIP6_9ACTN
MQIDPVFFNAGRWGLGYDPAVGEWSEEHVQPMLDMIGGVLPDRGPLRPVMYTNASSDDPANLPSHIRAECPELPRPLFSTPVGAHNGDSRNNGATKAKAFCCAFDKWLSALPQWHPYFAVIDSNECHHLSVPLSAWALRPTPPDRARIVVNFDAHADIQTGVPVTRPLRCDNWGLYVLRPIGDVYPQAAADTYVGIGNNTGSPTPWGDSFAFARWGTLTKTPLGPGDMATQLDAVITLLDRQQQWSGYDLYISVDRDIESSSFTDYGDGRYTPNDVWARVADFIRAAQARGVRCVGFDICGLPTVNGRSRISDDWSEEQRIDRALEDIVAFTEAIDRLPEAAPPPFPQDRLVSSG